MKIHEMHSRVKVSGRYWGNVEHPNYDINKKNFECISIRSAFLPDQQMG